MANQREVPVPDWQRQAWLTEYQALQHDNSSSGLSYWTLAGIFIGISSALFAALIYGVLANETLIQNLLQVLLRGTTPSNAHSQILALSIIILVLGLAVSLILFYLKRWLKRVNFLIQFNYKRMREIETELGMRK